MLLTDPRNDDETTENCRRPIGESFELNICKTAAMHPKKSNLLQKLSWNQKLGKFLKFLIDLKTRGISQDLYPKQINLFVISTEEIYWQLTYECCTNLCHFCIYIRPRTWEILPNSARARTNWKKIRKGESPLNTFHINV